MRELTAKEKKYLQYAAIGLGIFAVYKAFISKASEAFLR